MGGDDEQERPRRSSRVPAGRLERLARMGWMAAELAAGGVAEGTRRALGRGAAGGADDLAGMLLSGPRARRLAERLSQMRGAALKLGQLLSLEGEDLLPPELAEALAVLRRTADTMPPSQVRRVLGREYGKGWEARFRDFDFEPLAAASIGQVHAAVAADGRELALKVQYPGVARSIDSDVDNLAALLRVMRVLPVELDTQALVAEAKRQLRREADYQLEAGHLERYRALVADEPGVRVPRVHADYTTRRILAMERLRGRPIEELRGADRPQRLRDAVGLRLLRLLLREVLEFRFVQTDPNYANYLFVPPEAAEDDEADTLVLLDFGAASELRAELVEHYRTLCRALLREDRGAVRRAAVEIGYLAPDEREDRARALVDLMLLAGEPLRHEGPYDFGGSRLAVRAREAGLELAFRHGFLRAPPAETLFLHRKVGGTFLLCAHIRARVDVRALALPWLFPEGAG